MKCCWLRVWGCLIKLSVTITNLFSIQETGTILPVAYKAGRQPPTWLENFRANYISIQWKISSACCSKFWRIKNTFNAVNSGQTLFFRASTSCSKILNVKTIFNAMKIFRANSVFHGKPKLFKILKDKKYIQYSELRTHCFSGQAKIAQTSWM